MPPRFTMHCALPGCRRSSRIRTKVPPDSVLVSYRQEVRRSPGASRTDITAAMNDRIIELLRSGKDVILDDTNLIATRRRRLMHRIRSETDACSRAVFHCATYESCCQELNRRGFPVNEGSNWRLFREATPPTFDEGFHEIVYERAARLREPPLDQLLDFDSLFAAIDLPELNALKTLPHDSPYHSEDIGAHIWRCYEAAMQAPVSQRRDLVLLSIYHDIGKLAAREFSEKKGHSIYHGHDRTSAYLSACYGLEERLVRMVKYHQLPRDNKELARSYFSPQDWTIMDRFLEIDGSCRNF